MNSFTGSLELYTTATFFNSYDFLNLGSCVGGIDEWSEIQPISTSTEKFNKYINLLHQHLHHFNDLSFYRLKYLFLLCFLYQNPTEYILSDNQ